MKIRLTKERINLSLKLLIFLGVIFIISYLLPNQNRFKYFFELGKPWSYDLKMAPFDFPVYKSEKQIQVEKAKLLEGFIPFYKIDTLIAGAQFKKFINDYQSEYQKMPDHLAFLEKKWMTIYNTGIIASDHYQKLRENNFEEINCIDPDKVTTILKVGSIFTPKSAYQYLMQDAPSELSTYNVNLYLIENLKYDSLITRLSKDEMLRNLSFTSGIVQSGERIIDRGEIVTENQYLVLNSMKKAYENNDANIKKSYLVSIGEIIIISGLIFLFFLYMYLFRPRIYEDNNNLLFISLLIVLIISLVSLTTEYTTVNYFILPYALLPIIVRVFFDSRTALFAHIITTLIISLIVDNAFQFILLQIAVGMTAVSSLKDMTQRSQLAQTAMIIMLTYILTYLALELISEGDIKSIYWEPILYFVISSGFLLIAYLLIYIFEKMFGLVSAITLLELTNVNSDLMMQFAEKAPGTFQHTLQVSNLATEAAKKIGANSLLVRTGALYHDIGKMKNPHFFIENQMEGINPLNNLDLEQAAQLIIGHVNDGIEIARKAHLPEQIIHFIGTHHGFSKTKYFYNSFINAHPDLKPDDSLYTYPGPLPDTKETAILMMADAVEARARSLNVYTDEAINDSVEQMINSQIADGMFREAPISFRDVETVKEVFREKIRNMYHNRIVYPEVNKK